MEINSYPQGSQPIGVVAYEDLVEGNFVLLTTQGFGSDFGSLTDLPGVRLPDNDTEAQRARYCVTWTAPEAYVDGSNPMYMPTPAYPFALRQGFDKTANLPMTSVTVRMTWPGNQESQTIPSGYKAIVFGPGAIVTLPSGSYVYSSNLTPGARLEVLNTGDDGANAGKLNYSATGTIAEVIRYDSSALTLTVRILE